ncbi:homoserine kinase [Paenalkalicoccus suaedae]|uniref:Homoserine kinase n=1 Tax=Paenalkalicoccus suaedae TaxID=2592382 RepID=A0A859FJE5_9BACI|nr:homoserine kinase [Paenalkalicoccus suaedae]QKS72905.1 homoserine kinase [Paenalkalicoccus suaedae]
MTTWQIRVPASTANLGPGFDSIGLALGKYLTLTVTKSEEWSFEGDSEHLEGIPTGEDNLICQIATWIAAKHEQTLSPARVVMESEIPLSRGFGSSATAIVAGIELADQLLDLNMSREQKARWASVYEGHPDNVVPSIYGGLIIGSHLESDTHIVHAGKPEVDLVAIIPTYELSTKVSRGNLPEMFLYRDAVEASSISNVLVAAILQNNWSLVGKMMKEDRFHKPYRIDSIPEWKKSEEIVDEVGAYGVTLSGAGPILLFFAPVGEGTRVREGVQRHFPDHLVCEVEVDMEGVVTNVVKENAVN